MFRTVPLSIIRSFSLYTQQRDMSYRFADSCSRMKLWRRLRYVFRSERGKRKSLSGVVGILTVIRTGHFKRATACCSWTVRFYLLISLYDVTFIVINILRSTSLVVWWSESLPTNHEIPDSIPGSTVGIFSEGEDSRVDHGLGRLVEFRFKVPPGTMSSYITTHIIGTT